MGRERLMGYRGGGEGSLYGGPGVTVWDRGCLVAELLQKRGRFAWGQSA